MEREALSSAGRKQAEKATSKHTRKRKKKQTKNGPRGKETPTFKPRPKKQKIYFYFCTWCHFPLSLPSFNSVFKLLRNPKQARMKKKNLLPPPFWTIQKFVIPPLSPRANRPNLAAEEGEKSRLMPLPPLFLSAIPETVVYSSGKVGLARRTLGGRVDL